MHDEDFGHRRRRLHRLGAGAHAGARSRPRGAERRQADLCREPGGARARSSTIRATGCFRPISATAQAMAAAFAEFDPDAVVHLAAESHVDRSIDGPGGLRRDQCRRHLRRCSMPRCSYWRGLPADRQDAFRFRPCLDRRGLRLARARGPFTERPRYDPNSPYSASKAAADHLARAWHRTYGLPVIVTNCSNNYGPYQFPEKLIPLTIIKAAGGRAAAGLRHGRERARLDPCRRSRPRLHRRADRAAGPGEGYNFGGASERRNIDVVRAICAAVDAACPSPAIGRRASA